MIPFCPPLSRLVPESVSVANSIEYGLLTARYTLHCYLRLTNASRWLCELMNGPSLRRQDDLNMAMAALATVVRHVAEPSHTEHLWF